MFDTDIIIVGAGPVGLALANALLASELRCTLIEANAPELDWPAQSQALRVSAINCATVQFLQRLDVWQAIQAIGLSPYENMTVWDALSTGMIQLQAAEVAATELGFIVENRVLQKVLWQKLMEMNPNAIVLDQCQELSRLDNGWRLVLSSGKSLTAPLIIGADGAHSWLRHQIAIASEPVWYGQRAIVANVKTEMPHQRTAYQRFLPSGPLAFLPLSNQHHCSIVWTVPDAEAIRLCELSDADFNQQLTEAFAGRLGLVSLLSERAHFPLQHQHAKPYTIPGAALIGDAAHSIHPLAGQGVNLGLADAQCLAEVLITAHQHKRPIANMSTLQRYERERRGHNAMMLKAMNGFNGLFSTAQPGLVSLRGFGLNMVNKLGPIKNIFIKKAMGLM